MITVTFDGVEFTKATHVAKEFGYTSDYLGQLCRAKKVNARLVGRSWFINVPSLEAHRKKKYQSKKTVAKSVESEAQEIEVEMSAKDFGGEVPITIKEKTKKSDTPSKKYLRRVPSPDAPARKVAQKSTESGELKHVSVQYEADDHSLIPKVKGSNKVTRLRVGIADSKPLKIHSGSLKVSQLKPAPLPDVALSGSLSVFEIPDSEYTNEESVEKKKEVVVEESSTRDKLLNKLKMSFIDKDGNTHKEPVLDHAQEEQEEVKGSEQKVDVAQNMQSKRKPEESTAKVKVMIKPEPKKGFPVKLRKVQKNPFETQNKPKTAFEATTTAPKQEDEPESSKKISLKVKVVDDMKAPVSDISKTSHDLPIVQSSNQVQMIPIQVRMPIAGAVLGLVIGSLILSAEQVGFVAGGGVDFGLNLAWSNVSNIALVLFTG